MSKEQIEYSSLVAFTDQELQKQNNDIDSFLTSKLEDIDRYIISSGQNDITRIPSVHKAFYKKFVIERILTSRRLAKPYAFFDKLPYRSSAYDKYPLKGVENAKVKAEITAELKDKSVQELKEYIDTFRFYTLMTYMLGVWYCEKIIDKNASQAPHIIPSYFNILTAINNLISKHNAAIELAEKKAGVSTPPPKKPSSPPAAPKPAPPAATPPVTPAPPAAMPPVTQVPQVPKNNDEKKGDNSTLYIIAGGALLLGIIYFVRKKP